MHLTAITAHPGLDPSPSGGMSNLTARVDQTHILSTSVAPAPLSKFMPMARGFS